MTSSGIAPVRFGGVSLQPGPDLHVGAHAVDIRGTALAVSERMGLDTAVRDPRTQIRTLSAVRPDSARTYDSESAE
jgi:hypothetical protein